MGRLIAFYKTDPNVCTRVRLLTAAIINIFILID